jgi:iron(III) transport system permease protein
VSGRPAGARAARLAAGFAALLVLSPLAGLVVTLVEPPPDPFGMPAPTFAELWTRSRASELLLNSALLSLGAALGALLAGGWLAWAEQRLRYPGRRALAVLSLLPLATPSYLVAATVAGALGPGGWIGGPLGLPRPEGLPVAALVLAVVCAPYVQLLVGAARGPARAAEEEAARSLGAGPWRAFAAATLPRLRPALALSALISLLYAISDFGAVAMLNSPVLTWKLYEAVKGQALPQAALLGVATLGVTWPLFVLGRLLHGARAIRGAANPRPPAPRRPGAPALALTYGLHAAVIGLGVALPAATLAGWVAEGVGRGLPFASPWIPLRDSLLLAAVGALTTGLLAFAPAWVAARDRPRLAWITEQATLFTSALPGVLLALGLVLAALTLGRSLGEGRAIYAALTGSGALLLAGYAVRFLAEGFAGLKTAILQLDPRQEESARTLGASPARWLARVGLPALAPGAAASGLLLSLAVLKELPVTLLLGGAVGLNTLAFRVWDRYNEALWHDAGLAGLALELIALAVVLATLRWRRSV